MSKTKSESKKEGKSETNSIEFCEINKIETNKEKNEIKFILKNGKIIIKKTESCAKFVDPSYDSVFKAIFGDGNEIEGIKGDSRLLDLLNSLIFPKEKDKAFIEVMSISNEKSKIKENNKTNSGILRFDISCKAIMLDKNTTKTKIIDVEMQLGKKTDLITRMKNYSYSLYQTYKLDTILIAFMNQDYINDQNRSQYSFSSIYDTKGTVIKEEDNIELAIVNLKEEISKAQKNEKIFVMKKELDNKGISWLKLLGIRQWEKPINDFYYLPKNVIFPSKQMESAFKMLQNYNKGQLINLMRKEEEDNNIIKLHEEIGRAKGIIEGKAEGKAEGIIEGKAKGIIEGKNEHSLLALINLFKKKKESFLEFIDIFDYEDSTFKNEDIEKNIPDETERKEFKSLLQRKRKID